MGGNTSAPVYPEVSKKFFLERIGKEITLYDMSLKFRLDLAENPELGTPKNVLIDAGMSEEDIERLGAKTVEQLHLEVLRLTYPELMEKVDAGEDISSEAPADDDDVKKN